MIDVEDMGLRLSPHLLPPPPQRSHSSILNITVDVGILATERGGEWKS